MQQASGLGSWKALKPKKRSQSWFPTQKRKAAFPLTSGFDPKTWLRARTNRYSSPNSRTAQLPWIGQSYPCRACATALADAATTQQNLHRTYLRLVTCGGSILPICFYGVSVQLIPCRPVHHEGWHIRPETRILYADWLPQSVGIVCNHSVHFVRGKLVSKWRTHETRWHNPSLRTRIPETGMLNIAGGVST